MKVILYIDEITKIVCVLFPVLRDISIVDIGKKDIKKDIPFWVVNQSDLPLDIPQELWVMNNMGEPSGYGERE